MAEKKISRKELLNEPDEFLTFSSQAIRYFQEHGQQAIMGVVIVIVVVAGVLGYFWYQKRQDIASHELFQRASAAYLAAMTAPTSPSEETLNRLFEEFNRIAAQYSSYPAGEMALLYTGHVLYQKKDYQAALEKYEKMKSTGLMGKSLASLVGYHIAETLFQLKEYDRAVQVFEQLIQETDSPYRREAYGAIARIYELTGKKKEAVQAYRQYLKVFPEAPDAAFVKARIADLAVQG